LNPRLFENILFIPCAQRRYKAKGCTSHVREQRKWATRATTFIAVKRHQESHVGYGLTFVSLFHEDRKPASSRHERGERPRVPLRRAVNDPW